MVTNKRRRNEAILWHERVFKAYGRKCYFCGGNATDAMHIIPRALLGPLRFKIPEANGRPGCRECHDKYPNMRDFKIADVRKAIRAHNAISVVKLEEPE